MIPPANDKPLFTPGPLTTSRTVKQAMLRDLGSRDRAFIDAVRRVRDGLLATAGVSQGGGWEAVLMQGSGTFGVEAAIGTFVPRDGRLLILSNGAYGERIAKICQVLGVDHQVQRCPEDQTPEPEAVDAALAADPGLTHVAIVHCETTTGVFNPVEEIGQVVRRHGRSYFVDSMSAFGAVPIDLEAACVDVLVSSANKCIEGVPGFSFAVCRRDALLAAEGTARSLSLDVVAQWRGLESSGQFRFTPPTHAILAFEQALAELDAEGGVAGRAARYRENYQCLVEGMRALGFEEYLPPDRQGYIITSFRYPEDEAFQFEEFYDRLNEGGCVIYPGKVSNADCFRIGTIGRIFPSDVRRLLALVRDTMQAMGFGPQLQTATE